MSARTLIETAAGLGGYFGGSDAHGAMRHGWSDNVRAVDHSELGVRHDRWRWARGAPGMVMWSDSAPTAEAKQRVEVFLQHRAGAAITRHRNIDSYSTWSDIVELSREGLGESGGKQPFPGSKVQQLMYHGTGTRFRRFRRGTQGIIWFTSNPEKILANEVGAQGKGFLVSAYVNLQNPAGWEAYNKLLLAQFAGEGLDGGLLSDGNGAFDCFVFDPAQVRIVEVKPV